MTELTAKYLRVDNKSVIRVDIIIDKTGFNKIAVVFKSNNISVLPISVSNGIISGTDIIITGRSSIYLDAADHGENIDCIISYYKDNIIFDNEVISFNVKINSVSATEKEIAVVKTGGRDFASRLKYIREALDKTISSWHLSAIIDRDIIITCKYIGKKYVKSTMCFGDISTELLWTDFFFTVDSTIKKFIIPIEITTKMKKEYIDTSRLCCSELMKSDFHKLDNVFYKKRVSNIISLK